jgi:hypothetical protein
MLLYTTDAHVQDVSHFLRRPAFKIAQGKHLLLAQWKLPKSLPNTSDNFACEGVFLRRRFPTEAVQDG